MSTPVTYQVIFSGKLREGYTPEAVKKALSQRLKLSPEKIERLFAKGRTILKQTTSREQAERIVRQLASAGAIASIAGGKGHPAAKSKAPKAKRNKTAKAASARNLPPYAPLKTKLLFKPLLFSVVALESLMVLFYAGLLFALLFGVINSALFSDWGSDMLGDPTLGSLLQSSTAVLGLILLPVMLKPLLALRQAPLQGVVIPPRQEPDLHAFIGDVCERIGAPVPNEIRLHNDATIRTAYYRGLPGFFRNQPVLMIGVPLIAGMNSSQLAALTAQSLNRYRRTMSPRATTVLLAIHQWLHRAANGNDVLETALRQRHQEEGIGDTLFTRLHKLLGAMNKPVHWRMRLSQMLGRRLIHFIVDRGDQAALVFTGTQGFDRLLSQNRLLAFVSHSILPSLRTQWAQKGELPDNLVQIMVLRSRQYPADMVQKLRARQQQEKIATDDPIPSDSQRLERIAATQSEPLNECRSPAASLFRSYPKLTHTMTLHFYHDRLDLPVSPFRLKKVAPKGSPDQQLQQQLDHYFHRLYIDFPPLKLRRSMHDLTTTAEAEKQWQAAMGLIRSEASRAKAIRTGLDQAETAMIDSATTEQMQLAGLGMQWDQVKLKGGDLDTVHQRARDDEAAYEQAVNQLEKLLKAHAMRLGATLAILDTQTDLPEPLATLKEEAYQWVSLLERIENVHTQLRELQRNTILLETLISFSPANKPQKLIDRIDEQAADCKHLFTAVNVALKRTPDPFAEGKTKPLMQYVLRDAMEEETPLGHFDRGNDTVKRLALVQRRAVARLTAIGEQVEKTVGLHA